ncbi:hypothetical protein SAMN02927921_02900 [Sinomicrobium oceani]|uniref:O-antigen ligase like membrane protein n=1 Tax=Sinomicrobium oceani TaxID=1150368 RepID=A0A1K1QVM8_9FLAO|nr:hypothetical protein [Sinomicrobium oceani]SFW63967.1 hypothetical protein SAMN02927921_02900 [Sinomicrobium oceani]
MKISIKNTVVIFPILLIFVSEYFRFVYPVAGLVLKLVSVILMVIIAIVYGKLDKKLVFFSFLVVPFLIVHFFASFSYRAACEELFRYLFPIVVLFYGYTLRKQFEVIFKFLLFFLILNYIAQIINYLLWWQGIDQWFYIYSPTGRVNIPAVSGILRATGLMGFFSVFGFFNIIMYFLISFLYEGKFKKILLISTVVFLFLSLSFKGIVTFFVLLFFLAKNKLKIFVTSLFTFLIVTIAFPLKVVFFVDNAIVRLRAYILEGTSARSESYRIMFRETGFLFGEGLGAFGGPASTKYNSPFYEEVNFNWFGLPNLQTTDTYYPHLFVELGFIGATLYLLIFFVPLFKLKQLNVKYLKIILIVYIALFLDALFTYSLNNLVYLSISMLLIYPIIYYGKSSKIKSTISC